MKRVLAVAAAAFALTVLAAQAADSTQVNGWISDSMCGAKHAGTGADCVKGASKAARSRCLWTRERSRCGRSTIPDAVKDFYGDHVTVNATADASKKSVHIDSIAEAK